MTIDRADHFPDDRRQVWDEWQEDISRRCYGFTRTWRDEPIDIDNLVQESVSRAWRHHTVEPFPSLEDAVCWATTVLGNLIRDQIRHRFRHAEVPWDDAPDRDSSPLPDEIVEDRELKRQVRKALDALKPSDRAVIRAVHFEGMSYAQAATFFGIKESAFGVRLHRALARLRRGLADLGIQHAPTPLLTFVSARRRGDHPIASAIAATAAVLSMAGASAGPPHIPTVTGRGRVQVQRPVDTTPTRQPESAEPVEAKTPVLAVGFSRVRDLNDHLQDHVDKEPLDKLVPYLNAVVCVSLRGGPGPCLTSGDGERGERVFVRVPTKPVLGKDNYVDVEQNLVSLCDSIEDSDDIGCGPATQHPDPTAEEEGGEKEGPGGAGGNGVPPAP